MRLATLGLVCTALLSACTSDAIDQGIEVDEIPALTAAAGIEASFQVGSWAGGQQSAWLRLAAVDGLVGAYQGRIEFDVTTIELVRSAMTDSEDAGDFGMLNDSEADRGQLRFAGFAVEGFDVRDVAELRFKTPRPLAEGDLKLTIDVVGTDTGATVSSDNISVTRSLQPVVELKLGR